MSFLRASTSFTRFRLTEPAPSELWAEITDRLRQFAFQDIDDIPEERSVGWVSYEDMLDNTFAENPVEKGVYLAFSLRVDTRKIPAAVIKKHLAVAIKKEEESNRKEGLKFISRDRRTELREQVSIRLRSRFLPVPANFEVIWNTASGIVYFSSIQAKMLDTFQELFSRTFNRDLEQLTPFALASKLTDLNSKLDTLEPTTFA